RVHIRLHMPEIVRQHTHFHKVYKLVEPSQHPSGPPHAPLHPKKWQPQPHVSLLGYTTTASGTGHLSPDLTELISSSLATATPTLAPNYGPALFDNYNLAETKETTQPVEHHQSQLLQQLFKPNILAQQQQQQLQLESLDSDSESDDSADEPQLEHNELLNSNFLAALQREYMSKFGVTQSKRKRPNNLRAVKPQPKPKSKPKSKTKTKLKTHQSEFASNYVQDFDDYHDVESELDESTDYGGEHQFAQYEPNDDDDEVRGFDSATAFSSPNKGLSFLPTPEQFLNDVNSNTYLYDDDHGTSSNGWQQTAATATRPTTSTSTTTKFRSRLRRRPALDMITTGSSWASGNGNSNANGNVNAGHMRQANLSNRRKRKNRIKSRIYRI
ncbi:hypothetical protein KR222_000217, partial [Zaprionus bogoriensis]